MVSTCRISPGRIILCLNCGGTMAAHFSQQGPSPMVRSSPFCPVPAVGSRPYVGGVILAVVKGADHAYDFSFFSMKAGARLFGGGCLGMRLKSKPLYTHWLKNFPAPGRPPVRLQSCRRSGRRREKFCPEVLFCWKAPGLSGASATLALMSLIPSALAAGTT